MIRQPGGTEQRLQRGDNQRIYSQMRRFFAPSSIMPAPQSQPQDTGNRNTVLTGGNAVNSAPTDSAQLQLVAGTVTWYYKTKFPTPPSVTATPVGKTGAGTLPKIYLKGTGTTVAVVILSEDNTDIRLVNLHAVGAP